MPNDRRFWCIHCSSTELVEEHRSDGSSDLICRQCGTVYGLKEKPEPPVDSDSDTGTDIPGGGAA